MSATELIEKLKALPAEELDKVYMWLRDERRLKVYFDRADIVMKDAPRFTEEEILAFPRARTFRQ